jgi:hypothetical protein
VVEVDRILIGKPEETDHLEERDVDGRIILERIFRKWDAEAWNVFIWLRMGTVDGLL